MRSVLISLLLLMPAVLYGQGVFNADGNPFSKTSQKTREPKVVVDTVRFAGQYYSLDLRAAFSRKSHTVSATDNNSVFATITPMLDDSSKALYYYGYTVRDKGTRLVIKSSNANDSSKVVVHIYVK